MVLGESAGCSLQITRPPVFSSSKLGEETADPFSPLGGTLSTIAGACLSLSKPQLERILQPFGDPFIVHPGTRHGLANETDETSHTRIPNDFGETLGIPAESIKQVTQPHQVMIAFHGLPVVREAVLIVIAMVLLHQNP
jgi:hypothetical protein